MICFRIWAIARAFRCGFTVDKIFNLTNIDRWFLAKLNRIHLIDQMLSQHTLEDLSKRKLRTLKIVGFSDRQIAPRLKIPRTQEEVRKYRHSHGIRPYVKQIDTLAAEFPASSNYLYLTYQGIEHDVDPLSSNSCLSPTDSPRQSESFSSRSISGISSISEDQRPPSPTLRSPNRTSLL